MADAGADSNGDPNSGINPNARNNTNADARNNANANCGADSYSGTDAHRDRSRCHAGHQPKRTGVCHEWGLRGEQRQRCQL
jgi:hypothetical protein